MKMVGERPLNAVMENIEDVRKVKVKEAFEKATVKCKASAPRAPAPAAKKGMPTKAPKSKLEEGPSRKEPETILVDDDPPKKPAAKPPARLLVRSSGGVNLLY